MQIFFVISLSHWELPMFSKLKLNVICVLYNLLLANIGRIFGFNVTPIQAFINPFLVLLQNHWSNCLNIIRGFHFEVSRIFREGNSYAEKLANHSFQITIVV